MGLGKIIAQSGRECMKSCEIAHIAFMLIFVIKGVSSQTLILNPPESPPSQSSCDDSFAVGEDTFLIRGQADIGGGVLTEWNGLSISLEYADGSTTMCTISGSLGCSEPLPYECYCTGTSGQSYDFVFNLTALPSFSKRLVRAKWTSRNFMEVYSTSNQTLLEMNDPDPADDTITVNGIKEDLSSHRIFNVEEGRTASVKFCVGEPAANYDVTVEFEGSVVGLSNSNSQCVSGTFVPTSNNFPGNLTSRYTKDEGCRRHNEHACTIKRKQEISECWCRLDWGLPCPWTCIIIIIIIIILLVLLCGAVVVVFFCPQMIFCCCVVVDKDGKTCCSCCCCGVVAAVEVCSCCEKYRRPWCRKVTWGGCYAVIFCKETAKTPSDKLTTHDETTQPQPATSKSKDQAVENVNLKAFNKTDEEGALKGGGDHASGEKKVQSKQEMNLKEESLETQKPGDKDTSAQCKEGYSSNERNQISEGKPPRPLPQPKGKK